MEQKKRGPKPSGEKKRVLFVRVPEDRFVECKTAVARIVAGGAVPLDSGASGDGVRVKDGVSGDFVLNSKGKLDAVVLEQAARIEELERELVQARSVSLEPQSDDGVYWKAKFLEARKRVEELEKMGYG